MQTQQGNIHMPANETARTNKVVDIAVEFAHDNNIDVQETLEFAADILSMLAEEKFAKEALAEQEQALQTITH